MNLQQEIEKLVRELNYHSYRYHVLDDPEISKKNLKNNMIIVYIFYLINH